ncbi:serine/threonine protein kinase [Microlunatus endophyticus]|uniref:Serine/threonine protein kinase n=1 Tax=Microlunatus endophyticus TaxID=1716077 RepID=A0A917W4A9_9ACTN|nr:serine/threonine protein kinase [Microlunatus endophyticus]GGL62003.1 serine/threonine protein kinase [Microlunatus endophyticus]
MSVFLSTTVIDEAPADFVAQHGRIETEFSYLTQDSGNVSWIVDAPEGHLFVKTAGTDGPPRGATTPYFDRAGRVGLLRNAVELAKSCDHPALPTLLNVIESADGPMLVYEAVPGELIGIVTPGASAAERRADPASAYQRFAHLPAEDQLGVFDTLIDLHRALAAVGWVAGDLYDGCLIVDFATMRLRVVDLDSYRRGPSRNDMGRMFGSTRFMAPEEFERGAPLDERTTVFTLGRLVCHFGTRLTEDPGRFCGPTALWEVVDRAIRPEPQDRYPSVADFTAAWRSARSWSAPQRKTRPSPR